MATIHLFWRLDLCQWKREVGKICFSKILLPKNSRKIPRTDAVGKREKTCLIFFGVFFLLNGCRRCNSFFLVANCQHADRNQLVRRSTLDLNIDSTHGQPARCPARPTNIDDGLEDIRWIHGLGGESLPAASYDILPNLKKKTIFCHSRRIEKFCLLFRAHQRAIVFLPYACSAPATRHRPWYI